VSFAAITLYVACQRVIPKVSVYFVIDSIRKLLDIPSYCGLGNHIVQNRIAEYSSLITILRMRGALPQVSHL
jgi:hypothetical protein